jgi:hypothetical protein
MSAHVRTQDLTPSYGAKYPRIVRAVSRGDASTTRTFRHSFRFA